MHANLIFETCLYADDLPAAEVFYRDVMGLKVLSRADLLVVFRCGPGTLIAFDPAKTSLPGRDVPSHGAAGPGHLAFGAREDELDAWRDHLERHNIEIESEVQWGVGGTSIYFRDPAGNSIELAPPTLWGGGWGF
ncbi:MAG: VOC family protein [Planctomycetota bacterium]|jgi:catechol 2,3-dioxygenase-like lactoylglutathione lyase family enzyme